MNQYENNTFTTKQWLQFFFVGLFPWVAFLFTLYSFHAGLNSLDNLLFNAFTIEFPNDEGDGSCNWGL